MKLNKNKTTLSMMNRAVDDEYVNAPISERIGMVWDMTVQLWSIAKKGEISAQSRLQRHVARLVRREG